MRLIIAFRRAVRWTWWAACWPSSWAELKQQVIVENKAGANGNIAASYVAKAPGDGSVLFLTSVGAVSISPALQGPAL